MSEMIERVARAIVAECEQFDQGTDHDVLDSRHLARVAIQAMREPTTDMIDRGIEAMQDMDGESKQANVKHLWPAMIDEALR